MTLRPSIDDVRQLCVVAARAAADKKGDDTVILAVEPLLKITDAFVITSGTNARQVRTIADEVEEKVKQNGGPSPLRIEGLDDARWILMDYGDFVVHVFLDEVRKFYDLERLWADAERWPFSDHIQPAAVGAPGGYTSSE
ncbi:MAG TPA: ribosome silencing factor [Acidimicrobiales bacterium]|nr:ribosome silencing factor [Acidimicrobiales bacterium]